MSRNSRTAGATSKQVTYALALMDEAGLPTRYMSSAHKPFATMRERNGSVREWLASMDRRRASDLIAALKTRIAERAAEAAKPKTKRDIMIRAWEIARTGANAHGGRARDYIAEAMRMAHAEARCSK